MAIRTNAGKKLYTEQHRGNFSYDEELQLNMIEAVSVDPDGNVQRPITGNLALIVDDSADPIIYIGKAKIGTATSSDDWQVVKLDTTIGVIKTYADGDANFDNVWDNRVSLSYS